MANSMRTYPYPVLGNSDDIDGEFGFSLVPEIDQDEVSIHVEFNLLHETISHLLSAEQVSYAIEVSCAKTLYKKTIKTNESSLTIRLSAHQLRDRVEVYGYIIAISDIVSYDPAGTHKDLDFGPVAIDTGDIVADGGKKWFIADKFFDPLKAPVSSFIKIIVGGSEDGAYFADFDGSIIKIRVPETQYSDYAYANKYKNGVLVHAPIVLPVLVEAIFKCDKEQFENNSWANKLRMILEAKNLSLEAPYVAAQELLGLPIKRSTTAIRSLISTQEAGGND